MRQLPLKLRAGETPPDDSVTSALVLRWLATLASALMALAFLAGLYAQAGAGLGVSLIGGAVVFLTLTGARVWFADRNTLNLTVARQDVLEARFAQLAEDLAALDAGKPGDDGVTVAAPLLESRRTLAQTGRLAEDLKALEKRVRLLGEKFQQGIETGHRELRAELGKVETLVTDMAAQQTARQNLQAIQAMTGGGKKQQDTEKRPDGNMTVALDTKMLDAVRKSIEADKIDLYLQPIVNLPARETQYYEAFTRLRDETGQTILPDQYIGVAEAAGIMPLIDNVLLYRAVQVMHRLDETSPALGLFCNISPHSLLDPEFFPEFVGFMEQNKALAGRLFFEFGQDVARNFGPIERESLAALARLGFHFSLDRVTRPDGNFAALYDQGFRFIKIDAKMFLHGWADSGARIHAADMHELLDRHGLSLIVEKIEDEATCKGLLDFGVGLGQGYLFAAPRLVRPEIVGEKAA